MKSEYEMQALLKEIQDIRSSGTQAENMDRIVQIMKIAKDHKTALKRAHLRIVK